MLERRDLQRLLRVQIDVLGDDLYVLTEDFGDWEDSRRLIDLLAIDPQANLVVIELKRTNAGGHLELQAIRYVRCAPTWTAKSGSSMSSRSSRSPKPTSIKYSFGRRSRWVARSGRNATTCG